ncbi:DUF4386 domain-containing protein [Polaribacter gochangensis]|uniref:DUF4386 domain-containing protein n=1 Tax=Polaribacter gochangensis TaxID=3252903 RepID=UPI0039049ADC
MNSNKKIGRITGALLLFVFISGVSIFQFLQGAVLFSDNYITAAFENATKLISSVVLGIFSGAISIVIAVILLPLFKKHNYRLAYLYVVFCILNFIAIMLDNSSVLSMLEFSKAYLNHGEESSSLKVMKTLLYEKHWWTHYLYLLISCFPVFVLYYTLFISKLVPRFFSVFGIVAVLIMFVQELFSIYGNSISMDMLLPIGLIQLILPIWLLFKGFNSLKLKKAS